MRRLAVAGEPGDGVVMIDQRKGEGEVVPRDLLEGPQLAGKRQPLPAMLLRQLDGIETGCAGSLDGLQRIAPLPFPARRIGRDMFLGKSLGAPRRRVLLRSGPRPASAPDGTVWA